MGDIVTLVEKAQDKVDQDVALKMQRKVMKNRVTLEDLLTQFAQMEKMGPIQDLIKLIPGVANMPGMDNFDPKEIKRFKGIIQSMTKQERLHPEVIDGSRKRRIAKGSGATPQDINRVLKEFQMMRKMLGGMTKKGSIDPMALLSGEMPAKGKTKQKSRSKLRAQRKKNKRKRRR
jgi:signal recognition particle subunit SRP54